MQLNWKAERHTVSLCAKVHAKIQTHRPGRVRTHHADELGQRHHQLHGNQLGAISRRTDQFVVVGWVEEMLHQALLCVCPEASCNENTLSSPSSASVVRRNTLKPRAPLSAFVWKGLLSDPVWSFISVHLSLCLATALAARTESGLSMCAVSAEPFEPRRYSSLPAGARQHSSIHTSYKIWHHRSESTSLNVSIAIRSSPCLCSVSIHSPLLRCTSPQLPVFCSFRLFSLHLSLPPPPPVRHPSICSRSRVSGRVRAGLSQHHTQDGRRFTERRDAQRKTTALHLLLLSFLPSSVPLMLVTPGLPGICSLLCGVFSNSQSPHTFPLEINTGCSLATDVVIFKPASWEAVSGAGKQTCQSWSQWSQRSSVWDLVASSAAVADRNQLNSPCLGHC